MSRSANGWFVKFLYAVLQLCLSKAAARCRSLGVFWDGWSLGEAEDGARSSGRNLCTFSGLILAVGVTVCPLVGGRFGETLLYLALVI